MANIPVAVARMSTQALTNATFSYLSELAEKGTGALLADSLFMTGANIISGKITHCTVAESLQLPFSNPKEALE